MDCSLPGSSIHGIHQGRILEWVALSSSSYKTRSYYLLVLKLQKHKIASQYSAAVCSLVLLPQIVSRFLRVGIYISLHLKHKVNYLLHNEIFFPNCPYSKGINHIVQREKHLMATTPVYLSSPHFLSPLARKIYTQHFQSSQRIPISTSEGKPTWWISNGMILAHTMAGYYILKLSTDPVLGHHFWSRLSFCCPAQSPFYYFSTALGWKSGLHTFSYCLCDTCCQSNEMTCWTR